MRTSTVNRSTNETDIRLQLNLDGSGNSSIKSGNGFFDHMLTLFSRHSRYDLQLTCNGDTEVDFHHSAEDIGICLGQALAEAVGEKRGICRYGSIILPMDEALVMAAIDLSGRSCCCVELDIPAAQIGTFDCELVEEFLQSFCRSGGINLHLRQLAGINSHHIVEAVFKALGRVLRQATGLDSAALDEIPSTKGVL